MTYGLRLLDAALVELCDECGFDSRHLADEEAGVAAAFEALALLQQRELMSARPHPDTWSGAEYTEHIIEGASSVLQHVGAALGEPPAPAPESPDLDSVGAAVLGRIKSLTAAQRMVACPFMGVPTTVEGLLRHLIHDVEHHVLDVKRGLAALSLAEGAEVVTVQRGAVPEGAAPQPGRTSLGR